ncbi:MAG TPA: hypothetical protein VE010_02000, partial [Thermoanaerobaculia bacterium]|nr:hypothetical protein [Thermoanaerobaculia bacterium]
PGLVTGKLSDFAGVYALAVFACALSGRRLLACGVVAAAFTVWKLPLSDGPIAFWNEQVPAWTLVRVVDLSDLLALFVVPLAYMHSEARAADRAAGGLPHRRMLTTVVIAFCSTLAFVNTSMQKQRFTVTDVHAIRRISIRLPLESVVARLNQCGHDTKEFTLPAERGPDRRWLDISFTYDRIRPSRHTTVDALIIEAERHTELALETVTIYGESSPPDDAAVLENFYEQVRRCIGTATITADGGARR